MLFQKVVEDFPFPPGLRPLNFKHAMITFKPYFLGKVLNEVSPTFQYSDLVGASLIATSIQDDQDTFQLYDIVSSAKLPPGFLEQGNSKRSRWGIWCYGHFNAERERLDLHPLADGKAEHSGCEYIRYCSECLDRGWLQCIPPKTLERIRQCGYGLDEPAKKKAKSQTKSQKA